MSYSNKYQIPCPKCKTASEQLIFQSLNEMTENAANKIVEDEINYVTCPACKNKFQVKTGLLYCNHPKGIAIYYNPTDINAIDDELEDIKRMFGNKSYLSNPDKFDDWNLFKEKVGLSEGIVKKKQIFTNLPNSRGYGERNSSSRWTCSVCDGDETTGCLYF